MKMRKLIALISAAMMLCAIIPMGAMTVSAADAVLFDDFSDGNTDGWNCSETIVVEDGAMKWTTASWQNLYYNIKVAANTDYVLTFKMKATKARTVEFKFLNGSWGSSGITSYPSTSATEWTDYSYEFNSGSNTGLVLLLQSHSAMDIYLDDIKIAEPATEPETPETPDEPTITNALTNGDFETGNLNGWSNYSGTTVTSAKVHGGSYAMTSGNTASKYQTMTKQVFAATPNTDYTLTYWCYYEGSNAQPSFYTYIQDADGNNITSKTTYPSPSGAWEQVTVTFNSGELTSIVLYVKNRTAEDGGTYYFDDFMIPAPEVEEPEQPGEIVDPVIPAGNLVSNSTFENNSKSGWTVYNGTAVSNAKPKTGSYSLLCKGTSWNGIAETSINTEVGKSYQLTFWYYIETAGFNWKVTGNSTGTKYVGTWENKNLGSWQQVTTEFIADDTKVTFTLLGLDASSSPVFYVDDVFIVEVLGPSNDGFIVNGDFEVGKTTGWSVHQSTKISAEAANGSMYGVNLIGNGGWGGMLNQSFKTTKGLKYILTLDVKVNNYGMNMQVRNKADDATLASKWFSLAQNGEWATYTFEFTAVSTDTYLNFCGGGGGSSTGGENVYVDNIKIVEIPCEHVYDSIQDDECNTCGHIRPVDIVDIIEGGQTSISEDVNGLAFKFEITATGASTDNNNKYVSGSASINPYGNSNAYTLVTMGAVITNKADKATDALLNLNTINGKSIINIEANYLLDSEDGSVAFATRIINIPDEGKDTAIYARCYYVFEKDGELIVIYDDIVSKSYNG